MSLGPNLNQTEISGVIDILGGELNFGAGMKGGEKGIGFNFTKPFADGGPARQNFAFGRRAFLKWLGAGAAGIGAAKSGLFSLLKGGGKKQVIKELTSVPIGNPEGMPVWFKPLINKIIKEGDDVTKKFGTVDREIVHTKKIDKFEEVTVYQDLNTGNVRMEYGPHLTDDTGKVIRASNEPTVVQLEYKASEVIEPDFKTGKGGGKTKEEFSAVEAEPEVVNWEGDIEMSGENVVNTVDDLITDTSKLQKYATDNKLTLKEISDSINKQRYKNKLDTDPMEQITYIENKQGMNAMDYIDEGARVGDFDPKGYSNYETKGMNLPEKKADGGRIGFSGGGIFRAIIAKSAAKKGLSVTDFIKATNYKGLPPEVRMYISPEDFAALKSGQKEMYTNFIDMAKTRKEFQKNIEGGKTTPARELFEGMEKTMDEQSFVPKTVTSDDIAEMELMVKNRFNKGRKDNAQGGLTTMLGE